MGVFGNLGSLAGPEHHPGAAGKRDHLAADLGRRALNTSGVNSAQKLEVSEVMVT
ncbi:MAG: hypothetical protein WAU52_09930 [Burkholderiales bacterium]